MFSQVPHFYGGAGFNWWTTSYTIRPRYTDLNWEEGGRRRIWGTYLVNDIRIPYCLIQLLIFHVCSKIHSHKRLKACKGRSTLSRYWSNSKTLRRPCWIMLQHVYYQGGNMTMWLKNQKKQWNSQTASQLRLFTISSFHKLYGTKKKTNIYDPIQETGSSYHLDEISQLDYHQKWKDEAQTS